MNKEISRTYYTPSQKITERIEDITEIKRHKSKKTKHHNNTQKTVHKFENFPSQKTPCV